MNKKYFFTSKWLFRMKNFMIFCFLIIATSCSNEIETPIFEKNAFIGSWELVKIDFPSSCTQYLDITQDYIWEKELCGNTLSIIGSYTYEINGNEITLGRDVYIIEYLSPYFFKLSDNEGNFLEYKKP